MITTNGIRISDAGAMPPLKGGEKLPIVSSDRSSGSITVNELRAFIVGSAESIIYVGGGVDGGEDPSAIFDPLADVDADGGEL